MVHTLIYVLIINGLRTEVQSVDKITNQANRGGRIHKGIHRALRFWGGVRGVGACICWGCSRSMIFIGNLWVV